LYQLSKRGLGFNDVERREAWLLATGALQAMNSCHHSQSYKALLNSQIKEYPSLNKQQITVDLHRTFPDEDFWKDESKIDTL